jgi:hypothetical protein
MILGSYRFICTLKEAKQECNVVLLAFIARTSLHVYLIVFLTVSGVLRLLLELEMSLRPHADPDSEPRVMQWKRHWENIVCVLNKLFSLLQKN